MSSAIFLPKLQGDDNSYTDGFVGMAPMVEAWKLPLEGRLANFYKGLAWLMTSVGAGKSYVPKGGQHHCKDFDFETNPYTNDRDTFDRWHELMGKVPHFLTRGPTYGWVQAYYENAELLKSMPDNSIKVPTKVFLASDDTIVRNETAVPFLNRVYAPDCLSIEEIRGTKHGLDQGGPEVWSKIVDGINELVNNAYVPLTRHREKCMALAAD
jgi:alpha-beta hydrolase superfamily lysophospholipase